MILDSLCWFSQRRSPTPILEVGNQGAMTPKFELSRHLCTMHLPQVSSSCIYSLGSYGVDKQTNKHKQTNRRRLKHPTLFATLQRWVKFCHDNSWQWEELKSFYQGLGSKSRSRSLEIDLSHLCLRYFSTRVAVSVYVYKCINATWRTHTYISTMWRTRRRISVDFIIFRSSQYFFH